MAPIKLCLDLKKYPAGIKKHLAERISSRNLSEKAAEEWKAWLRTAPIVPDLPEAPKGWHKILPSCMVLGEGEFVKTLYTSRVPGSPRPDSIDLDKWIPGKAGQTAMDPSLPDGVSYKVPYVAVVAQCSKCGKRYRLDTAQVPGPSPGQLFQHCPGDNGTYQLGPLLGVYEERDGKWAAI